jgi:hypothetical protein
MFTIRIRIRNWKNEVQNQKSLEHQTQGHWLPPLSLFFSYIEPAANNNEIDHTEYLQNKIV